MLQQIEADVAFLKQALGCCHIHRKEFGLRLVPADLSGLLDDIVAADLDQCLPDTLDRLAMWFLSKFGGQGRLQVGLGHEHAAAVGSLRGKFRPALGDTDRAVGVLAIRTFDEHGLELRLAAVREEIQQRTTGFDPLG